MKRTSLMLVGLQSAFILALLVTGPLFAREWRWLAVELAGIAVVLWAVWAMRLRQLRISPEVAASAMLVERGPYRWVRHPMYTGALLTMLALVLDQFNWWRLVLWAALVITLIAKLRYEERLLRSRFLSYDAYRARTKALVPFVW